MMGKERLLELIETVLQMVPAEQAEVLARTTKTDLTRIANSDIHQNIAEVDIEVSVRVIDAQRLGQATTNRIDQASLKQAVDLAVSIARGSKPNADFSDFAGPQEYPVVVPCDEDTYEFDPLAKAEALRDIVQRLSPQSMRLFGFYATGGDEFAVGNSNGLRAYHKSSRAGTMMMVYSDEGSGHASAQGKSVGDINIDMTADKAADKCRRNRKQIALEPGRYTVILESEAVANLLSCMPVAFGGDAVQNGSSAVEHLLGQQALGTNINMWEDGTDPRGYPVPFDVEGMPKRKFSLVEQGVIRNVAHSRYTAAGIKGASSTGSAVDPVRSRGRGLIAAPTHVFMQGGDTPLDDMIADVEYGVLVTRFYFQKVMHPVKTLMTGLTRDGTFLIRNGKIDAACKNLRFTETMFNTLNNVTAISRETEWCGMYAPWLELCMHSPALRIEDFLFNSVVDEVY